MKVYHLRHRQGLTVLHPHQTKEGESDRFGLFLAPTLEDAAYWLERLIEDRGETGFYLYEVEIDDTVRVWTDGDVPGTRKLWKPGDKTWLNQIWVEVSLPSHQVRGFLVLRRRDQHDLDRIESSLWKELDEQRPHLFQKGQAKCRCDECLQFEGYWRKRLESIRSIATLPDYIVFYG